MSDTSSEQPDGKKTPAAHVLPVPTDSEIRLRLVLDAISEAKGMTYANRLALYEQATATYEALSQRHAESLRAASSLMSPPHLSWKTFARRVKQLGVILHDTSTWV